MWYSGAGGQLAQPAPRHRARPAARISRCLMADSFRLYVRVRDLVSLSAPIEQNLNQFAHLQDSALARSSRLPDQACWNVAKGRVRTPLAGSPATKPSKRSSNSAM